MEYNEDKFVNVSEKISMTFEENQFSKADVASYFATNLIGLTLTLPFPQLFWDKLMETLNLEFNNALKELRENERKFE